MPGQARVTSIDALETFRAELIIFMNKAQSRVEEVVDEVRRTRGWLEGEQRMHWEREIRRRRALLSQAEAELMSAKLSSLRENIAVQQMAVRRAHTALVAAEEKLRVVKQWIRNFDSCFEPLTHKLETLRQYTGVVLPQAAHFLQQAQRSLEGYAETAPASPPPPIETPEAQP